MDFIKDVTKCPVCKEYTISHIISKGSLRYHICWICAVKELRELENNFRHDKIKAFSLVKMQDEA